jgi:hypothetical protein
MVELFPTLISSSSTSAPAQFRQVFAYERTISNTLRDATTSSGSCRDFVKEVVDGEDKYRVTQEGLNKIAFYSVFSTSKSPAPPSPVTKTVTESSGSRRISGNNNSNSNSSTNDTAHSTTSPPSSNNHPANFYTGDDIEYPNASRPAVGEKRKVSPVNIVANTIAAKKNWNHNSYQQLDDDANANDEIEAEGNRGNKMDIVDDESNRQKKSEVSRELLSLTEKGLNDLIIPSQLYGAGKPVEQRDLKTGRFIRCYVSLTAAAAASGICRKKIASCCSGLENTTPFKWVYRKLADRSRKDTGTITITSIIILPYSKIKWTIF